MRILGLQNRPRGCMFPHTCFAFQNKVYQFRVRPFGLSTTSQMFTQLEHSVASYLHRQGISVLPDSNNLFVYHLDILFNDQFNQLQMLELMEFKLNVNTCELKPVNDFQLLSVRALLPALKAWEIFDHAIAGSSHSSLRYHHVASFMGSLN